MNNQESSCINDILLESITCPICQVEFNLTTRKPLILNCGHTICLECLQKIENPNGITCPFDRQTFKTNSKSLSINYTIYNLVDQSLTRNPSLIRAATTLPDRIRTNIRPISSLPRSPTNRLGSSRLMIHLKKSSHLQKFGFSYNINRNNKLLVGQIKNDSIAYQHGLRNNDHILEVILILIE